MNKKKTELFTLRMTTALTILYAIVGVVIAVATDSMTLLLDGLYGIADVIISLIAILVVNKLHEPPNQQYHFGYAKYEPFMTAVDGILITTICVGSALTSVQDLIHPEPMKNIELAIYYSFISFFVCVGIGLYVKDIGKKCGSEILKAEGDLWFIEGVISIAVALAFWVSKIFTRIGLGAYESYVDPVMCIILSLALLYRPLTIMKESFRDLVDASPADVQSDIMRAVRECKEQHQLENIHWIKIRKAGRKLFISICFETQQNLVLKKMHEISDLLTQKIQALHEKSEVFVSYRAA